MVNLLLRFYGPGQGLDSYDSFNAFNNLIAGRLVSVCSTILAYFSRVDRFFLNIKQT